MKKITFLFAFLAATVCVAQSFTITNIPAQIELSGAGGNTAIPFTINYDFTGGGALSNTEIQLRKKDAAGNTINIGGSTHKSIFFKPVLEDFMAVQGSQGSFMIPLTGATNTRSFFNESIVTPTSGLNAGEYYVIKIGTAFAGSYVQSPFSEVTLVANGAVLSTEQLVEQTVSISPNPVSDVLNVNTNIVTESYRIYNLAGSLIKEAAATGSVSVSELSNGIYFLRTDAGTSQFVKK
jgi:hypothetical protein